MKEEKSYALLPFYKFFFEAKYGILKKYILSHT